MTQGSDSSTGPRQRITEALRDPIFHYIVTGLLVAVLSFVFVGKTGPDEQARRIEVDAAQVQWLHQAWQARWHRPPTAGELRGLVDDRVRQEVMYRTGLAMGLDRDDEVFRRRIQQKIEMMTEDIATRIQPTEVELQAFFAKNLDDYRIPEERGFTHIYFNLDERGDAAVTAAEELLARLHATPEAQVRAVELGDRFMLAHEFAPGPRQLVSRDFGERFATALFELPPDRWQGPVTSGYGLHLVRIDVVLAGRTPDLAEVSEVVLRDYAQSARERARAEVYANLVKNYTVEIDEAAMAALPMTPEPKGESR